MKDPHTHKGSRRNLLGDKPDRQLVEALSNETRVTAKTPPVFLFHTRDDAVVPVQNSTLLHDACKKHDVPVEMHLYPRGRHGVGLAKGLPDLEGWPGKLEAWLKRRGLLTPPAR